MGLKERTLGNIKERRDRVLEGKINCIPFPFDNFREDIPGIEKGRYYIVTGATKSAKTQFGTYTFVYYPIMYAYAHPDQCNVRILYFAQEETPEQIMTKFLSFLIFKKSKGKYRISPLDLKSTNKDKPLCKEILDYVNSLEVQSLLDFFEDHVDFIGATNPTGVWKTCLNYAHKNGTVHSKTVKYTDEFGQQQTNTEAFDWYEPNDPNEYRIIFFDHVSLVNTEKNMNLRESIQKLSEYFVTLRNRYQYIPVAIQQQAMFETLDAFKMDMLKPSIANLADNKATSRDCDVCLSVFSPYKYGLPQWKVADETYDISLLKDNIRFIECLLNRHGISNGILPLMFDGAVNYFAKMPRPSNSTEMNKIYGHLTKIRTNKTNILFFRLNLLNNGKHYLTNRKKKG